MADHLAELRHEPARPSKLATLVVGFGLLLLGIRAHPAPDWDASARIIMAGSTYLSAGWSIHVMIERRWCDWPLMLLLTCSCVDGSYALYWLLVDAKALALIRRTNWPASLSLFLACGLIRYWRGMLGELAWALRGQR